MFLECLFVSTNNLESVFKIRHFLLSFLLYLHNAEDGNHTDTDTSGLYMSAHVILTYRFKFGYIGKSQALNTQIVLKYYNQGFILIILKGRYLKTVITGTEIQHN